MVYLQYNITAHETMVKCTTKLIDLTNITKLITYSLLSIECQNSLEPKTP